MSCPSPYPSGDPAELRDTLQSRMPAAAGNADRYLRDAAREFFRKSECWRDRTQRISTNETDDEYTATPDLGVIARVDHVWCGQRKVPRDTEKIASEELSWFEPSPGTILFSTAPGVTTYRLELVLMPGDDYLCDSQLLNLYREIVIDGAQYYAAMAQAKKTSDRQKALDHRLLFMQGIDDAAFMYQRKHATERQTMTRYRAMNGH